VQDFVISSASHRGSGPSSLDTIGVPVTRTATPVPPSQTTEQTQSSYVQQLAQVPELASYGAILNSSKPVPLTENETEYQVSCVKHMFSANTLSSRFVCPTLFHNALILNQPQFNVSNTMPDTILEQVSVIMQPPVDCGLTEDFHHSCSYPLLSKFPWRCIRFIHERGTRRLRDCIFPMRLKVCQ
jgi:coatomer protein complex subunit gamma